MSDFGRLFDSRIVTAVTLENGGRRARLIDYGARLIEFRAADGPNACVASDLGGYQGAHRFTGPVVGPVINRIAGATADIVGKPHHFEANQEGRHTLHSGAAGTHAAVWRITQRSTTQATFEIGLAHGEGGFPGKRRLRADYTLEDDGALLLEIRAKTDAPTLLNPGLHGVWNPDGTGGPADLRLTIPADRYLPTDSDKIPTGEIAAVAGTPFDHRAPSSPDPALDHNYCFAPSMGLRARLTGHSGRTLEIHSDAPGLQAYSGGAGGVALEPQLWPDAPHHSNFPSILVRPGETFGQTSRYVLTE